MRHPPYNLKVHKEADRAVMVETIRRVISGCRTKEAAYHYYSFGGPFLEDLKRIHAVFPAIKLTSLESNGETYKRQDFHRFLSPDRLELVNDGAQNYFKNVFSPSSADIIWLDYLKFGAAELADFTSLVAKLAVGSMLRITINGEARNDLPGLVEEDKWKQVFDSFKSKFGDLVSNKLEADDFLDEDRYCRMINSILISAAAKAINPRLGRFFQPLVATHYRDETRMLSLMGIISSISKDGVDLKSGRPLCDRRIYTAFSDWDLSSLNGEDVHLLDVPSLSNFERLVLQRHLPIKTEDDLDACCAQLPYRVGNTVNDHKRCIARYTSMAPYYSIFSRIHS